MGHMLRKPDISCFDFNILKKKKLYIVYSSFHACPKFWKTVGHSYVMTSADLIKLEEVPELRGAEVIVDSGGFRRLSKGIEFEPEKIIKIQKVLYEELDALPVILDYPPRSPDEAPYAIKKTAKNIKLWQKEFGDDWMYVVHAFTREQFKEAMSYLDSKPVSIGIGLAKFSKHKPSVVIERLSIAREFWDGWLHALGVGGSTAILIFLKDLADTADSSSPIQDATFRTIRDPLTMRPKRCKTERNVIVSFAEERQLANPDAKEL